MKDRKEFLLRAAYDILKQCDNNPYVIDVLGVTTKQNGVEFDGLSLMEDIKIELERED